VDEIPNKRPKRTITDIPVAHRRTRRPQAIRHDGHFNGDDGANITPERWEFMDAIDRYKRENHRPFISWSEVYDIFESLGHRKVAPVGPLPKPPPRKPKM
jgi:hypothetical protein